jgi:methionyl aminopeptidase
VAGIILKSTRELARMRRAGLVVWAAHHVIAQCVRPGISTGQLDAIITRVLDLFHAEPLFLGVPGPRGPFPAVSCISVNEELVHGIPGNRVLQSGDIVSIDIGCRLDGWCGDAAWTYPVGDITPVCQKLLEVTRRTLELAIEEFAYQPRWSIIAGKMAEFVRRHGFSVVEDFAGHGIGRQMHEAPQVPNFIDNALKRRDIDLQPGLVLAIEPMVNVGSKNVRLLADGWTVVTSDGQPSAHFEHTVARTEKGAWVLTDAPKTPDEEQFVRPVLEKVLTSEAS